MSAAIAAGGASEKREDGAGRRLDRRASAPSRKMPSATTFRQLAGRPARHGPHTPHFGSGSTITRWPTARPRDRCPDGPDAADELVAHDVAGVGGVARWDVEDLEVRAADSARLDLDDDIVVRLDVRLRYVLQHEPPSPVKTAASIRPASAATPARSRRARPRTIARETEESASVATSMTVATAFTSGVTPNLTCV